MTSARKGPVEISPLLGVPLAFVFIPLLFILAGLSIPYVLVMRGCIAIREHRLLRRLVRRGRAIGWCDVEQHLAAGQGTLIIEQAQKETVRFWWTTDDVISHSPVPIPAFDDLDFMRLSPPTPFVAWCHAKYLAADAGTALLSRPKGLDYPAGFVSPEFFLARFPAARIVATIMTR